MCCYCSQIYWTTPYLKLIKPVYTFKLCKFVNTKKHTHDNKGIFCGTGFVSRLLVDRRSIVSNKENSGFGCARAMGGSTYTCMQ